MNYNIIYNILEYLDIESVIKLIDIDKNIIDLVTKEQLINKFFDIIEVIDINKYYGNGHEFLEFITLDVCEDQILNLEDKIIILDIIKLINKLNIKKCDLCCDIFYNIGTLDFNKFENIYNLVSSRSV